MTPSTPTPNLLIWRNYEAIDQAILHAMPKSGFSINKVAREQANREFWGRHLPPSIHPDWTSLDTGRRSSACRLEWARLMLFSRVYLIPALEALEVDAFHVIVADKRWQVNAEDLSPEIFDRPRRKLRRAMQLLRSGGANPVFVAVNELSAARNLDGSYIFEPHIHLLVLGVTRAQLTQAFKVRQHRSDRGKAKPLRIVEVKKSEIANVLGYLSKIKPQERVQYVTRSGRRNRATNRTSYQYLPLWLSCMGQIPITQLIQFGGFADSMTYRFATCEMATLIGEL